MGRVLDTAPVVPEFPFVGEMGTFGFPILFSTELPPGPALAPELSVLGGLGLVVASFSFFTSPVEITVLETGEDGVVVEEELEEEEEEEGVCSSSAAAVAAAIAKEVKMLAAIPQEEVKSTLLLVLKSSFMFSLSLESSSFSSFSSLNAVVVVSPLSESPGVAVVTAVVRN